MLRELMRRLSGARARAEVLVTGDSCVVRSNGLHVKGLPEVEISGCPLPLKDVASNLVVQIALNGQDTPESVAVGKTIGGRFVRPDQPLIEIFRFAAADRDSLNLRIVDLDSDSIFPHRLVATHLCASAGTSRSDAVRLLLVATEVWPKEKSASEAASGDYEFNPNNFWSWIELGTALSQAGLTPDAILRWKTAACMWPRGAKLYASRILERDSSVFAGTAITRAAREFWQSVSNDAIKVWCAELDVDLTDSALADAQAFGD